MADFIHVHHLHSGAIVKRDGCNCDGRPPSWWRRVAIRLRIVKRLDPICSGHSSSGISMRDMSGLISAVMEHAPEMSRDQAQRVILKDARDLQVDIKRALFRPGRVDA